MPLAIPEVDTQVYRQGPAEWMAITARMVPTTTAQTKIVDDKLPITRPNQEIEVAPITQLATRPLLEFYDALKTSPDHAIQMADVDGEVFNLTQIGRTRPQPILFPLMERPVAAPFAVSCAAPVAVVIAASDEEFTLEEAVKQKKIRVREFWHLTLGQPILTVHLIEDPVHRDMDHEPIYIEEISTNRLLNRQNVMDGQPIILVAATPRLIRVGDVLMYTYVKPPAVVTPL